MGLFDGIQNILGDAAGSVSDAASGVTENLPVDGVADAATAATDAAGEAAQTAQDSATSAVEDVTKNLGL